SQRLPASSSLSGLFAQTHRSSWSKASAGGGHGGVGGGGEIEWEVRPGGMLVQKRDGGRAEEVIMVRVSTGFSWHDVSIGATRTFGEYT
uniref:Uncharacterized protein n=1 Tax=Aegilops tauschii subsp. strangulata TaxID=200361 RepID=A0A453P0U7_AEGTS